MFQTPDGKGLDFSSGRFPRITTLLLPSDTGKILSPDKFPSTPARTLPHRRPPPILAAADGIVVDANAIDPWGESYGYYIKIQHDESFETLYTHCLTVFVMDGEEVDAMEFFNKQTNLFRAINHSK